MKTTPVSKSREHVDGVRSIGSDGREGATPWLGGTRVSEAITIDHPLHDVYAFWRDFSNFARFSKHLREVATIDAQRSRWTANGPGGKALQWEATLIEDKPDERIAWRSKAGAEFENAGSVQFRAAPESRGTEVHLTLSYNPPAGPLGSLIAALTGNEPAMVIRQELRRVKQLLETGEISTIDGQAAVEKN